MKKRSYLFILVAVLLLMGQGCLGGSQQVVGNDGGVFATADAGQTWTKVVNFPTNKGVFLLDNINIVSMIRDPQDPLTIYMGTRENGMYFSYDNGVSWQQPRASIAKTGIVYDIAVDPTDACTLYVTKSNRLLKSEDCGRTFDSNVYVETRSGVLTYRVEVDWHNPNIVWMALSNGELLKSEDGGENWRTELRLRSAIRDILLSSIDSRNILLATQGDGFYRRTADESKWTHIEDELKQFSGAKEVKHVISNENSSVLIASTTYGLLRSYDFGSTWEAIRLITPPGQVTIGSFGIDLANPDTLYYTAGSTFYASQDGGNSWNTTYLPSTRPGNRMLVDPQDPTNVFVGVLAPAQ